MALIADKITANILLSSGQISEHNGYYNVNTTRNETLITPDKESQTSNTFTTQIIHMDQHSSIRVTVYHHKDLLATWGIEPTSPKYHGLALDN